MGEKNNAYLELFNLLFDPGDKKLVATSMPEMTFTAKIDSNTVLSASLEEEKKEMDELPFDEPNDNECEELEFEDDDDECSMCFHAMMIPVVKSVIFNGPATTILWADNTKTTVKVSEGQQYDRYAGFCACVVKKLFGSSTAAKHVMDDLDIDLIRQARAAEQEKAREQRRREEEDRRVKKALRHVPSERELRERAYDRALEMVIDRMAIEVADNIEQRMAARTEKEEAKEQ